MKRRIILTILSCLVFCGLFGFTNTYALTLYVNVGTGVDGPGHGTSAADPFKTITYALKQAPEGTTISVASGTYNEALTITKNLITLKGAGRAITTINGNGTAPTIQITGPVRVTISGFSITGGKWGILCEFSHLTSSYNTIKNNLSDGLAAVNNSHLKMKNTIVESNPEHGVLVSLSSSAWIEYSTIRSNNEGLWITLSSSVYLLANKISLNTSRGIMVTLSSSTWMTGNEIYGNHSSGLETTIQSSAELVGKNKIHNNGNSGDWRGGISVYQGSRVQLTVVPESDQDEIYGNDGPGIHLQNNSSIFLWQGKVNGNGEDGVSLRCGACVEFWGLVSITNNGGWGYSCDGTNPIMGAPTVCSGNAKGCTNCP